MSTVVLVFPSGVDLQLSCRARHQHVVIDASNVDALSVEIASLNSLRRIAGEYKVTSFRFVITIRRKVIYSFAYLDNDLATCLIGQ